MGCRLGSRRSALSSMIGSKGPRNVDNLIVRDDMMSVKTIVNCQLCWFTGELRDDSDRPRTPI